MTGATLAVVPAVPAAAVTDENPSFYVNANDLDFILRQIQIAESHAAGNDLLCPRTTDRSGKCVPSPALPFGLRTVDGTFNNLLDGRTDWGSADRPFPQLLTPEYREAEAPLPFAPPPGDTSVCVSTNTTCYAQWQPGHFVYDSEPRVISNLVVDQTTSNPAAVNAAEHLPGAEIRDDGSIFLPNMAPDEGLSAPTNAWFTFFGQFFDHGLDLVDKGGNGTLVVPLRDDDPLRDHPDFNPQAPFLMLTRATRLPGPDGVIGTADDQHNNQTTPFVDQNQTYTSHPSHQVFLRGYELVDDVPRDTGHLLDGTLPEGGTGGLATWNDIKRQAREVLGIDLDDGDVLDIPQVATDYYGNFLRGPNGFPLLVVDDDGDPVTVEGDPDDPISTANALRTGHAFLDDIAHGATPIFVDGEPQPAFDDDGNPILDPETGEPVLGGYDNVTLGEHFITGDGRGNENVGLSAVHHVFHAEHNRLVAHIEDVLEANPELHRAYQGLEHEWPNKRPEDVLPGPEADDWTYEQRLFQAARFVNEMEYQHLVFEEFARTIQPAIEAVVFNENSYDANIDPAITAEFAHVVYRFGHSMLTEDIARSGFDTEDLTLLEGFLNPRAFDDDGRLTPDQAAGAIANGTTDQVSSQIDEFVIDTLRNDLLGLPLDLATINILRGRDTGTPPLQEARRTFFEETGDISLRPYESWVDFGNSLKNGNIFGRDTTNASLVNFVAAYGTHPTIVAESTVDGKRAAASLLVNGVLQGDEFLSRIAGINRYETAQLVSASRFDTGVDVAYVTTGTNFPDALAGGPAAAGGGGPILLVNQNGIPMQTAAELIRLNPGRIVVLGGSTAISNQVVSTLRTYTGGTVSRVAGDNRYETAAQISRALAPNGADKVYVATGANFPDSLAASAVAARDGNPILLTTPTTLHSAARAELVRLAPSEIVILGGTSAVSAAVQSQIQVARPGATVSRVAGTNRYDTAAQLATSSYTAPVETLYVATGANFPDSLAVGPVAGLSGSPLLLVPSTEPVPQVVLDAITALAPTRIVVLGGTNAVSQGIEDQLLAAFSPVPAIAPADRHDFMNSRPGTEWENASDGTTVTGVDTVDFWTGGLAERVNPFGGMLGATFNHVFEQQLEDLQFGDRFYYLFRNQGNQLFAALEANSFASLVERTTDASNLPANIFLVQEPTVDLADLPDPLPEQLTQTLDGTYRWLGDEHVEFFGTPGDDRIRGDQGDDSLWGKDGDDVIEGGSGNDTIVGGAGNDILTDLFGDDVIKGGLGNDVISSGPGFDLTLGGAGDDFVIEGGDVKTSFLGDGNDVLLGGTGPIRAFAGEGDDWVEGGSHADLLQGDNGDQFQADVIGGNDVVIGRGGGDDIEGEGGDDILVGEAGFRDRHLGNLGFDWVTYYGETRGVDVDMSFTALQRPDVLAVRDRFDQLEAVSGGAGNDVLRGLDIVPDENETQLHKMTFETLDLVDGLRDLLQPGGGHDNYALPFMQGTSGVDEDLDGLSNILIGGLGSDRIEGRGGDDFIDGDAYLRVQLALVDPDTGEVLEAHDSAAAYRTRAIQGQIDPGNFRILREIAYDDPDSGAIDTAVYRESFESYEITDLGDGYLRVTHEDDGAVDDGSDVVRNVEFLEFSDVCYNVAEAAVCEDVASVTLEFDGPRPVEDQPVTARLLDLDGNGPLDMTGLSDVVFHWWGGFPDDDEEPGGDDGDNLQWELLTSVDVTGPVRNVHTYLPDDRAVDKLLRVTVTYTDAAGITQVVSSEALTETVQNVPDAPIGPAIDWAGSPTTPPAVGQVVSALPPRDDDGILDALDEGLVYQFQVSATQAFASPQTRQADERSAYQLQPDDAGMYLRVVVEYTDDRGADEVAISRVVGPVTG